MKIASYVIILLTVAGCASSPSVKQSMVSPAVDVESKSAKTNLTELVTHYLIYYINLKAGLSVERINKEELKPIELVAAQDKKEESVFLRVSKLRIFSDDALLKPLEADLTLEVEVLDKNGTEIYRRTVAGHHENQTVFVILEESAENLAKGVVKDTLKQLIQDPELKKIIAKYKYGTLGAIASIF